MYFASVNEINYYRSSTFCMLPIVSKADEE